MRAEPGRKTVEHQKDILDHTYKPSTEFNHGTPKVCFCQCEFNLQYAATQGGVTMVGD